MVWRVLSGRSALYRTRRGGIHNKNYLAFLTISLARPAGPLDLSNMLHILPLSWIPGNTLDLPNRGQHASRSAP